MKLAQSSHSDHVATRPPSAFPRHPSSWYYVCTAKSLRPGQVKAVRLCGQELALFRSEGGAVGALAARCPHLGSDLSSGRVVGDTVECPYHRFRFNGAGTCREQDLEARSYPVEERYGAIFVFLGPKPLFPFPSFPENPDLVSAEPVHWTLETQWYMVTANGFDARHFSHTHDRSLVGHPILTHRDRFCLHIEYKYEIAGSTWIDRVTRMISGSTVDFDVAAWGGNIALVRARFAKDQSLGIVLVEPNGDLSDHRLRSTRVTVIVNAVRRGNSPWARLMDRITVGAKRFAIRRFMIEDEKGLLRLDYTAGGLRAGDEALASYLRWVAELPREGSEAPMEFMGKEEI